MTSDEKRYFDAGYLQGYHAGYWDSQDDYVMLLFETQNAKKQRRNQQQGNQQTTAQSNLRRQLRGQMRLAARGNQGSHTSQYFSGEILKTKRAPLRNTGQDHYIVLLETQQGKRRIVDLGPTSKYGRNDIHQGQQVSVQGRMAHTRDDVPVLLARNVRVAGENITINRSSRQSSHQQQTSQ